MKKTIAVFAILIIASLTLFQISKFSITSGVLKLEIVLSIIAISFFIVGAYFFRKKAVVFNQKKQVVDENKIKELGLSARELEVLQLVSKGFSNIGIANHLNLTESTIKTHVSNILLKLNVKSRTQAVIVAKEMQII